MPFLKQAIRDQKLLEAEIDINTFIEENNITDNMIIYWMAFDKEVFQSEVEVAEYLRDKYYDMDNVEDNNGAYTVQLMNTFQVDLDSTVELELRRGVTIKAAEMLAMPTEEVNFSELPTHNLGVKDIEICLSEGLPFIIEVCRVAEGYHSNYGQIKITREHLESMERNFKNRVTGVDLAINEDHKKNEAFAWFKDVYRSFDGDKLYAHVVWNTKGTRALSEKEYRYFSPEFRFNYTHPHTNVEHGPTLLGGALTNYPFLKMGAIVELNENENKQDTRGNEMSEKTISLSDHNEAIVELNNKLTKAQDDAEKTQKIITSLKEENVELNDKVKKLEAEKIESEKKAKHEKLFAEGKISSAQLTMLNEGKDLVEILSLNSKMNTESKGTSESKNITFELSDDEKAYCDENGHSYEDFAKWNNLI